MGKRKRKLQTRWQMCHGCKSTDLLHLYAQGENGQLTPIGYKCRKCQLTTTDAVLLARLSGADGY